MTSLGGLCLELLSGKGLEWAFLEGIGLKHETVLCHHGGLFPKPPWKQGRSHGCTDFGFLLAGICQTGTTASKRSESLSGSMRQFLTPEVWKQVKQAASSTVAGTGFAGHCNPHHDCSHHDLVCRGD